MDATTIKVAGKNVPKPPPSTSLSPPTKIPSSSELAPRIVSGSLGSIITALAVTPLEVAKIRQQISMGNAQQVAETAPVKSSKKSGRSPCSSHIDPCSRVQRGNCTNPHGLSGFGLSKSNASSTRIFSRLFESMSHMPSVPHATKSEGTVQTLRSIFRSEGISGLYAGLQPTLIMTIPSTVLHLATYDEISSILHHYHRQNASPETGQSYIPVVAGSLARLSSSTAVAPLELIRTRQASYIGKSIASSRPGYIQDFRSLVQSKGVSSLYAGLGATLSRDVPFAAVYWSSLEHFKILFATSERFGLWGGKYYHDQGTQIPASVEFMHTFFSGASAGAVAAMLTTPFDVVKTRRQMVGASSSEANLGAVDHLKHIVQKEGIEGLWKGNQTRMMKLVPAYGIMIACYELGKKMFGNILDS